MRQTHVQHTVVSFLLPQASAWFGLVVRRPRVGGRPRRVCISPKVLDGRGILSSRAGTIVLSGALWPIVSFGSPGAHNLSVGTQATRPSPQIQWILSPATASFSVRPLEGSLRPRLVVRGAVYSVASRLVESYPSPVRHRAQPNRGERSGP